MKDDLKIDKEHSLVYIYARRPQSQSKRKRSSEASHSRREGNIVKSKEGEGSIIGKSRGKEGKKRVSIQ